MVVGSVALDTVETPLCRYRDSLGGSAVHFAMAARHFSKVRLLGIVGKDFPEDHVKLLENAGIDISGLEIKQGLTFRWEGRYSQDMNRRETVSVALNLFGDFKPMVPEAWKDTPFVFLANASPWTQLSVLNQVERNTFVLADTMDLWIETEKKGLMELLSRVKAISLNDSEARALSMESNLIKAGKRIQEMGPEIVIIKRGEHGATLFTGDRVFPVPAYPTMEVCDPTGAGDSFAGGFMGALAETAGTDPSSLKKALVYGTACASINVEHPSVDGLLNATRETLERRRIILQEILSFG